MAIPPEDPTERSLQRSLHLLAADAGAINAVVADANEQLVCDQDALDDLDQERFAFVLQQMTYLLALAKEAFRQSRAQNLVRVRERPSLFASPFGASNTLLLWFEHPFDAAAVEELVRARLPEIERLTAALPPPDLEVEAALLRMLAITRH
jgi:hypothetical protein